MSDDARTPRKKAASKPVETDTIPAPQKSTKTVTAAQDLRVVTKDFVVLRLTAGVPRELAPAIAFEAQRCAADAKVELTVE